MDDPLKNKTKIKLPPIFKTPEKFNEFQENYNQCQILISSIKRLSKKREENV